MAKKNGTETRFFKQFESSFYPDDKQKAQLKAIVFAYYKDVAHISFIESPCSSAANTNLMICIGRTNSSPKIYYGVYEFIDTCICKPMDLGFNNKPEDVLNDACAVLEIELVQKKTAIGKRWMLKKFESEQ